MTVAPRVVEVVGAREGSARLDLADVEALVPDGLTLTAVTELAWRVPNSLASVATSFPDPPSRTRPTRVSRVELRLGGAVRALRLFEYPPGSEVALRISSHRSEDRYTAHVRPDRSGVPHYSFEVARGVERVVRELLKTVPFGAPPRGSDAASNVDVVDLGRRLTALPESVLAALSGVESYRHRATLEYGIVPVSAVVEDERPVRELTSLLDDLDSGTPLEWAVLRHAGRES